MNLTRVTVNLVVLAMLTTTWARSITEHRDGTIVHRDTEPDDNSLKRYLNEKDDHEGIRASKRHEESEAYDEMLMKRYARSEAEKLLLISTRISGKRRRSLHGNEDKVGPPFSTRRLEKMLEKAILKIITGDLSTADMLLLKSLNYSLEEVLSVRERELGKKNPPVLSKVDTKTSYEAKMNNDLIDGEKSSTDWSRAKQLGSYDEERSRKRTKSATTLPSRSLSEKKSIDRDFDFDAYNRQASYDYETAANKITSSSLDLDSIEASLDYENRGNDQTGLANIDDDVHENFARPNEPHVVFKIRYDDSEFDSSSNERVKQLSRERKDRLVTRNHRGNISDDHQSNNQTVSPIPPTYEYSTSSGANATAASTGNKTFQLSTVDVLTSLPVAYRLGNFVTPYDDLNSARGLDERPESNGRAPIAEGKSSVDSSQTLTTDRATGSSTPRSELPKKKNVEEDDSTNNETSDEPKRKSIYEGLEWVEDDVYRVIPEAVDSLNYYDASINEMDNGTIEDSEINGTQSSELERQIDNDNDDIANDTNGYQNENPQDESRSQTESAWSSMSNSPNVNLSTYQQLALAHRRDGNITSPFDSQGQKAIEDIKLKVLAMTGRFNLTSSGNQVQRERLTMFSPICQLPRNTDAEAWSDPFSMNMNFQLNLTAGNHVVAAKVRIYVLPQTNITVSTVGTTDNEDEEEKKIRISIYFYTKSLKKHRSKKRLIDSVVISLTTQGSHWALDVRQALRFWRQNLRNSHGLSNNHGLVIQVEDQDGRSLKPSQFIQQDSCHTSELNGDEKINESLHSSFKPVLVMFVS